MKIKNKKKRRLTRERFKKQEEDPFENMRCKGSSGHERESVKVRVTVRSRRKSRSKSGSKSKRVWMCGNSLFVAGRLAHFGNGDGVR